MIFVRIRKIFFKNFSFEKNHFGMVRGGGVTLVAECHRIASMHYRVAMFVFPDFKCCILLWSLNMFSHEHHYSRCVRTGLPLRFV